MEKIKKIIDKILWVLMIILFITMFGVTILNVIMRFVFNNPIAYAVELGRYSFVSLTYIGAIYVMRDDGHIGMDVIINWFPKNLHFIVVLIGRILVCCFLIIFTYGGWRITMSNIDVRSSAMEISMAIPYGSMLLGGLGMLLEEVLHITRSLKTKKVM